MLDNIRNLLYSDETPKASKADGTNPPRVFDNFRSRASNVIPSFNFSVAGLRDRAFKSPARKDIDIDRTTIDEESARPSRSAETSLPALNRLRSRSTPAESPYQSRRRRAILLRDSTLSDLRARANAFDLSRLPSFHFSLPFSDSNPPPPRNRGNTVDNIISIQTDTDNASITSLEFESLATKAKAQNNRLRGLIEGLPRLGIPGMNPVEQPFAGLSELTKDLNIVVLGGYRGSILRSAEDNRMLWIPVKVGLGIRKVDLELALDPQAESEAIRTVYPDGMLSNIGPIDISRRLLRKLREMEDRGFCKVHNYGFDWRLGGQFLSDQLVSFLANLSGKTIVIAHSLGGLITLHALNRRPDLFASVLFAGVPFGGCPNILGPFRYGDGVLLNKDILNARTNFSMRSSFILLPTHKRCFVDILTGKELPVDFFDPNSWREYGLSPEVAKDHGVGDVGEASDVNGMLASGGIGGPAIGGGSTNGNQSHLPDAESSVESNQSSSQAQSNGREKEQTMDFERRNAAQEYLERTLKSTWQFKSELKGKPDVPYPPMALLRSASTPTVRGCNVLGEQGIKAGDYSKFIFSPGDGVVTYAAADIRTFDTNDGQNLYSQFVVKDVENDRGHIGLLGDLAGVEECLSSLIAKSFEASPAGTLPEESTPTSVQNLMNHPDPFSQSHSDLTRASNSESDSNHVTLVAASNLFKPNLEPSSNVP